MSKYSTLENQPEIPFASLARTDLHLLAVFMTVVESGGFSAAQVALNLGQSTVSRHMADLESRLGMRLCQRGRVGFRLTEKGARVYEASQRLFKNLESFRSEIGALSGQLVGKLSFAVIDNWVTDTASPLTAALAAFKTQGPNVQIEIHCLAPDDIELAVLDSRVSIGIGVFHQHRPGLAYKQLYQDPLELYCGQGHELFESADSGHTPAILAGADYVRRAYLSEEKVAPLVAHLPSTATAHQVEGVAFLILTGRYIGYLPKSYALQWVLQDRMRSILPRHFILQTNIEVVTRRGVTLTAVEQTFLQELFTANKHSGIS